MPIESNDDDDILLELIDGLLESDNGDDEAGRQGKPYQQCMVADRPVYWESLWGSNRKALN